MPGILLFSNTDVRSQVTSFEAYCDNSKLSVVRSALPPVIIWEEESLSRIEKSPSEELTLVNKANCIFINPDFVGHRHLP